MLHCAGLLDELDRSEAARAAMALLETALARRSVAEQTAFWHAVDLYYVSRKAPPEPAGGTSDAAPGSGKPAATA